MILDVLGKIDLETKSRQATHQVSEFLEKDFKLLKLPKLWNSPNLDNEVETFSFTIRYRLLRYKAKFKFFLEDVSSYKSIYETLPSNQRMVFREEITRNLEAELGVERQYIRNLIPILSNKGDESLR